MGIEPTSKAWEAFVLPLNYTRRKPPFYWLYGEGTTAPRDTLLATTLHGPPPGNLCRPPKSQERYPRENRVNLLHPALAKKPLQKKIFSAILATTNC